MRSSRNLQFYSLLFILFTTFTAAWPWPKWLPERDSVMVRRQDSSSTNTAQPTSTHISASPSSTDNKSNTASGSGSASGTASGSQTASGSNTGTITSAPSSTGDSSNGSGNSTSYDATNPAGGVSLISPASTSTTYIKVGDTVTFAWNYTSLLATPTAVDIMASCTLNNQLYTIAMNQSVGTNSTQTAVWDTNSVGTAVANPLIVATYTLIIYDAASSVSATAQPGYLQVYDQYTFGMYTPQPYQDLSGWVCATCNSALGPNERRVLGLAFGMAVLTVLSFTWFINGLGIVL